MTNGGTQQQTSLSLGQQVINYASSHLGQQVETGECYDLADTALTNAGAKSAPDYGKITATADYKWGQSVSLLKAQRGDIVQFRDYKMKVVETRTVKKVAPDGGWTESTSVQETELTRPHHTAVVGSASGDDFTIYEQNVAPAGQTTLSKKVQKNDIKVKGVTGQPKTTTTPHLDGSKEIVTVSKTVTVTGKIWVYRPEKK